MNRSELKGLYEEWSKQKEIVDRLKKRIEESNKFVKLLDDDSNYFYDLRFELRKILGGENETN